MTDKKLKEQQNLGVLEVKELKFQPIDYTVQNNRINQLHFDLQDEKYVPINFNIPLNERHIYHQKNLDIKTYPINLHINTDFLDDNQYQLNSFNFSQDSISNQDSLIYHQRKAFLDNSKQVKINDVKESGSIKLGDKDPWAM